VRFIGTKEDGRVVVLGVPLDVTTSFRPGTRFAPSEVRRISFDAIESYSPYLDADIEECDVGDLGDLELPFGNVTGALDIIEREVSRLLERGKRVVCFGGEHLLSLAAVKAHLDVYPDIVVLHVDAHTDLRDEYLGERLSHATVLRRIVDLGADFCQVGVRSGTREEFAFASDRALFFHPFSLPDAGRLSEVLGGRPVYLSLDVDVLDPSCCPGVGTPEPGGVMYSELVGFLAGLSGLNLVGADVVELCPLVDSTGNSAVVGASLLREVILLLCAP